MGMEGQIDRFRGKKGGFIPTSESEKFYDALEMGKLNKSLEMFTRVGISVPEHPPY